MNLVAALAATLLLTASPTAPRPGEAERGVRLLWRTPLPSSTGVPVAAPALDGERLFAAAGGLRAWDARTGRPLWQAELPRYEPRNVVVEGGRVLLAESVALAFDAATGRELWRFTPDANASLGWSAAGAGAFYFGTASHRVYALSAADGRLLWSTDVAPEEGEERWTAPAVVRGVALDERAVYAAVEQWRSPNGHLASGWLIALDRAAGRVLWRYRTGSGDERRGAAAAPVVAGERVIAGDFLDNALFAVDRTTGREVWRVSGERRYVGFAAPPTALGRTVYAASGDTFLYALDAATGRRLWRTRLPAAGTAQAVCGEALLATFQGVAAMDLDGGRPLARLLDDDREFTTSPFAVGGARAYVLGPRAVYALACP
jgi:outer membrane protein assembly factor BamB